jgi:hypothetical protein
MAAIPFQGYKGQNIELGLDSQLSQLVTNFDTDMKWPLKFNHDHQEA